jgi:hypothetical protein
LIYRKKIKQSGYDIKLKILILRQTTFVRLFSILLDRALSIERCRHNQIVPVRLLRAQYDEHSEHEDGHFSTSQVFVI